MLSKLKDDILRLLKEDEEFRYAVIGLLGLQRLEEAIVRLTDSYMELKNIAARLADSYMELKEAVTKMDSRLSSLENIAARLADIQARQEERLTRVEERLEEHDRKFNAILERLDEHTTILQEHTTILQEHTTILQEHTKRLEEHDRKFNEIIAEIRDLRRVSNEHTVMLRNMQGMMIHGFAQMGRFAGISLESLVRSILTNVMRDNGELPKDKELTSITIDGEEIDIFCDDPLIVGEVTSYADRIDEVYKLVNKVRLVRDRFNKEPKHILLIITNIKREVYDDMLREAESNGIEVIIGKRV